MKCFAAVIFGFWSASAAAQDATFALQPNVPDYIALFNSKPTGIRIDSLLVRHHGEWIRTDTEIDNQYRETNYNRLGDKLSITARLYSSDTARPKSLQILRGAHVDRETRWEWTPVKTAERDAVLGEPCEVWEVGRIIAQSTANIRTSKFSCVAQDGIELRSWFSRDLFSVSAVSLVRRDVPPSDVIPPAELFDLETWTTEIVSHSNNWSDATVTMHSAKVDVPAIQKQSTRLARRHYPWVHEENIQVDGRRRGTIQNDAQRLRFYYEASVDGQLVRLNVYRVPIIVDWAPKPVALNKQETILGETCSWFDISPGMADRGLEQCQTADGLILKERQTGRGTWRELIAVQIDRRPVPLSDVSPAAMLARSNWGLAD